MKQHPTKIFNRIAAFLCILVAVFLLYVILAFFGNPISLAIAKRNAKNYLSENLSGADFQITRVAHDWKTGGYYAFIESPSSQDSYFTIYFDDWGRQRYDTYDSIGNMNNTVARLDEQYRKLVDGSSLEVNNKFDISIAFGELRIADVYEIFSYTDKNGEYQNYTIDKDYGLDRDTLVLDQEYDTHLLGTEAGRIVLYIHDPAVTVDRAAELLLEVKDYLDQQGVPFHAIHFNLCAPRNEEGQLIGDQITLYDFLYADIYEDGLVSRVQEHWDLAQEHHALMNGIKKEMENLSEFPVE